MLYADWLETPLGTLLAIADEIALYRVEFIEKNNLDSAAITWGRTNPILSLEHELQAYFSGSLTVFTTPLHLIGTPFQQPVWETLRHIPYGETRSYLAEASAIGRPSACRAVASAIGANPCAIIVPCHRVIRHNGTLGGYAGGITRKQWLLSHEKRNTL